MSDAGFSRRDRLASALRQALAGPVSDLAREEGLGLVSVTRITIAPDLRRADVYLSIFQDGADKQDVVRTIGAHSAALQSALGRQMRTKRTPVLRFLLDDAIERGDRVARLLKPTKGAP